MSVPGCGDDVSQDSKFASPGVSPTLISVQLQRDGCVAPLELKRGVQHPPHSSLPISL